VARRCGLSFREALSTSFSGFDGTKAGKTAVGLIQSVLGGSEISSELCGQVGRGGGEGDGV